MQQQKLAMHHYLNRSLHHYLQLSDAILSGLWRKRNIIPSTMINQAWEKGKMFFKLIWAIGVQEIHTPHLQIESYIPKSSSLEQRVQRRTFFRTVIIPLFCFHCFACCLVPVPSATISGESLIDREMWRKHKLRGNRKQGSDARFNGI